MSSLRPSYVISLRSLHWKESQSGLDLLANRLAYAPPPSIYFAHSLTHCITLGYTRVHSPGQESDKEGIYQPFDKRPFDLILHLLFLVWYGFSPSLKGHKLQPTLVHLRIMECCPPMQSRHMPLMALRGLRLGCSF